MLDAVVEVLDAVVEVDEAKQVGVVTVFVSKVTAPFRASNRPCTVALVSAVMLVSAMIVPVKLDPVPSVAELPICQNTLQAWAPFVKLTLLADAVVSVEPA